MAPKTVAKWIRRLIRCESGVAAVEFGIVFAVVLLPMASAFIELGRGIQHYQLVVKSMRDATRYLGRVSVSGAFEATPCSESGGAGASAAGAAKDLAIYGKVNAQPGTDEPLLTYWADQGYGTICIEGPMSSEVVIDPGTGETKAVDIVRMVATVAYDDIGFLSLLGLDDITFTISHEERHIGD